MTTVVHFDERPPAARLEYLRHVIGESVVPLDIRPTVASSELRGHLVTVSDLGAVRLAAHSAPPAEVVRGENLIRRSDPELCKIDLVERGQVLVEQDGRQSRLRAGDLAFVDLSRPSRWIGSRAEFVAVMFPRALLPLPYGQLTRITGAPISGRNDAGALVAGLTRRLARQLTDTPDTYGAESRERVGTALLDLLTVALATQLDGLDGVDAVPPESRRRVLLLRIHSHIDQRLADPELSPATVAAAHHISVRYLHRLFESQEQTVAGTIRRRRLERCRRDLLDPALRDRPVSAIGARWGFLSAIQFSRAFRAAYGVPPGEYRRAWKRGPTGAPDGGAPAAGGPADPPLGGTAL